MTKGTNILNVLFLDFDGVVNTPQWYIDTDGKYKCKYNFPSDRKVNNWQAVQWVSEFCEKYNYKIVISSTWRKDGFKVSKDCLINGGLRKSIEIIGITPVTYDRPRGEEISGWLLENPDATNYLIFDDDSDMGKHLDRLVKCDSVIGFGMREFNTAITLHDAFNNK